ncbi:ABC transporter ATP-binding protein [Maridesulfovibrio zosterae]|uniref:ABC transporter ATP-binding protein n=1 Tax=Maridesulfovibrio zosterae TaxID=82171 RepID=UPI00040D9CB2|nr:ATP-binding cassette domain-containing protein [Maridesulfovibrio zosterae]
MNSIIKLTDIHKKFGNYTILSGFNLDVKHGEVLALLGPSGIGKSTILRIIAGLEKTDSGSVEIGTSHIGYVFQEARLLPWDTTLNNVALPLRALGVEKHEALDRSRYFLKCMELSKFEGMLPHQLSGGMCQRVSIARALAINPKILLLDEPFTGLDKKLKNTMRSLLESSLDTNQTAVIQVTHDHSELLDRTNRTLHLTRKADEEVLN